ncbi:PH domain-containing protein [Neisseria montereyensis]|uniref:PH domain-containing protein n=1 Tax=Neisseria montereyensis TaxID=2973938 RepID=A0ABT2F9V7_9NEIS|nr:PH domain-containing protein [Neisseria montereyensis]MCS4532885.1 PH domain-containing protein [Neisseria montereyensis]
MTPLNALLDSRETVIWQGKPSHLLYTIGTKPWFYVFAIFWGLFDWQFFLTFNNFGSAAHQVPVFPINLFILIHLAPVWYAIFAPTYRFFNWYRVIYALTDRRIYLTSGLVGNDIKSIEWPEVKNLSVDVGFLENMMQRGTISVSGYKLMGVENPYDLYKRIKDMAVDISSDRTFPNEFRPAENPGYNTRYKA